MPGFVPVGTLQQKTTALKYFYRAYVGRVDIGLQPTESPVRLGLLDQVPHRQCRLMGDVLATAA